MKLLDICETIVDCPHSTAKDEGKGHPLIRTPNVGKGRLKLEGVHRVSENVYNLRNERAVPQENDLILAREAPVGNVAIIKQGQIVCLGQRTVLIRPNRDIVDPDFLVYYLLSPILQHRLLSTINGATVSHLNMSSIRSLEVELPDIKVQRKIGAILARIDDKIELNNRINANLEQQAQTLFKSWFVDFGPFGGKMPDDWIISTLGEVSDMGAGGDKPNNSTPTPTAKNTIPIYSNGLTDEGLYGYTDKAKIQDESVTVSARGTIGYVCLRQTPYVPIVRLVTLIPKNDLLSSKYLYHWLKTLHIAGTGTTQQQLTVPSFKKTEIVIPDSSIMERFTKTVNPFYSMILTNKNENQRLAALRDTLLPKLMSGEIHV